MGRIYRQYKSLFYASVAAKETAINTEQTMDQSLDVAFNTVMDITPRRTDNSGDLTGKEEVSLIYDLGATVDGVQLSFEKAQPNHFAFLLAYGLGAITSAAAGDGYSHVITPIAADLDAYRSNPSFTGAMRFGDTILKRRFASLFVDQVTARFPKDDFAQISATIKGSGKYTDNIAKETVTAAYNASSLTLAANAVHGSTAAGRLDNVHRIRVDATGTGQWEEVTFTAVSAATPAVISITAPGGTADDVDYEILYVPTEAAWCTAPAKITETAMRISECSFNWGGQWDGSDFNGGKTMSSELDLVEWTLMNNQQVEFGFGAGGTYANRSWRDGRQQKVTIDREFRDGILKRHLIDNDTFGMKILYEGALFDDPHKYTVQVVLPKCGLLNAPLSVNGKKIMEKGDIQVMEDATYGSCIWTVKNLQAAYAA